MSKKQNLYLNDFVTNQMPIAKYKNMISIYLNLIDTFQIMLDDDNYNPRITPRYELKMSSTRPINKSQIDGFLISTYDDRDKMQNCIIQYHHAFNNLNEMERKVFYASFVQNKTDLEIIDDLAIYSSLLNKIRKSAIVKFCLCLGFDKFVNQF